jgi:hypothetical protein
MATTVISKDIDGRTFDVTASRIRLHRAGEHLRLVAHAFDFCSYQHI